MKDPERLLSVTGEGDELERELLGSLRGGAPPPGAKGEAWQKIGVQIAAVTLIGGTVGSAAAAPAGAGVATALATASATKLALVIAAAAVVLGGSAVVVHHRAASHAATVAIATASPAPTEAPELAPVGPMATALLPVPANRAAAANPAAPSRAAADGSGSARLTAESALLTAARAELRSGDAKAAQSTLARMQAEFPHGVLWQEREVLLIEALAADGKTELAARRARAFIAAHPESPHSTRLGRFLDTP
jgi:outer membrane lipoprotein YfiO